MNWKEQWINDVLAKVPEGSCRDRMEAELYDHLETQRRTLLTAGWGEAEAQAEVLRTMGEPDKLREEYRAAWRRTLPELLEEMGYCLRTWVMGCIVMFHVYWLVGGVFGSVFWWGISLPGDSLDPQIRMIRGAVQNFHNSWLRLFIPLVIALLLGAYYLSRKFQTSLQPAVPVSVGLFLHLAFVTAIQIGWEALDDHMTFWEEAKQYLAYNAWYYCLTTALCVLLGVAFGYLAVERRRSAAA